MGDSITAGVGSATSSSYRRPLATLIGGQSRYDANFVGSQASGSLPDLANEGHSGWIIDQVRAQIDGWMAGAKPDVVTLHLGINDLNRNVDVPNAPARFKALVDRIMVDKPGVTVIVIGLIPTTSGAQAKVATFNAAIKATVTGPKIRHVDSPALTAAELPDGLHPNDAGYQRMANVIYPALDRAYSDGVIAAKPALNAGNEAGGSGKVRWADFDGDGKLDYLTVASNGAVQAFLNRGGDGRGGWSALGQVATGTTTDATRVRFADFDGDSRADYLVINPNGSVSAWLNRGGDGRGGWSAAGQVASGVTTDHNSVRFADFDGDGKTDYLTIAASGAVSAWLNRGVNNWSSLGQVATGTTTDRTKVRFADLDGDTRADYSAIAADGSVQGVLNRGGDGRGGWLGLGKIATGLTTTADRVSFSDFTGDGNADYILGDPATNAATVYAWAGGDGHGSWTNLGKVTGGVAVPQANGGAGASAVPAADLAPKPPRLPTPWSNQVSTSNPLPEYPRPQLTRTQWQSLNGTWQFAPTANLNTPPIGTNLAEEVLVPYPIESALSGIERHENRMYYRRTFTVPAGWSGQQVQLNFGAVMWQSKVWVNGTLLGTHEGGYDAFSYNVTSALRAGSNEIIVGVWNPVDTEDIPLGKQRLNRGGIWYTPTSGIWQTVWLEPTNAAKITRLDTTPNVAASALDLTVQGTADQAVTAQVLSGGQVVGQATGTVGTQFRIAVPNARLWSPDDPFLYDLKVTLGSGDAVGGYFGMRSVGKAMLGGVLRPTLNGKFVFQLGTLDQGYWPDGLSTAPTDEALRFDLEQQKALGFNMVRKHIKVESARWFYHADKLGLMVWQDMPALVAGRNASATGEARYETELRRMIENHKGITSIVQWVPFNEGWGEFDAGRIADLVKSLDPTRLVNHNSGSNCCDSDPDPGNGDVIDDHMYVGPGVARAPSATRILALGEYGGLGLHVTGHEWSTGDTFAYEMLPTPEALTNRYVQITSQLSDLITGSGLSASVYTEPTDVEDEINGFFTYDRQVRKMDFAKVREVNLKVIAAAKGTVLPVGKLSSLKVTTTGLQTRYLRHANGVAATEVVNAASAKGLKQDSAFWVRPGLADAACYSFESRNFPGQYLRHFNFRILKEASTGGSFNADATFCAREGLSGGGTSLESKNLPGYYLRHRNSEVWLDSDTGGSFREDSTWNVVPAWWRSGADLAEGQVRSFRVTTPGYTNRYLRHLDGAARTDVIDAGSPLQARQDASFIVRPGLAESSCYSLESRNFPGQYLRHRGYRLYKDANDGTATYKNDATFCAQPARAGGAGNVSLQSFNYPTHYVRHANEAVYIAVAGGANPWDGAGSYDADTTWADTAGLGG
ncbi:AbfB domain-containing protein [Kribbella sp. NPDC056861]|uniref:AbfB domain-containing protein n=1 Tax=Kribbella sp. NPDC056861 TaxID=3154857 RepID=UPI003431F6D9